ncbi:MAG: hypothetical protein PHO10_04795 [Gemmiger sp.]|nr:hypothetical protein [Gemmiger sp.]
MLRFTAAVHKKEWQWGQKLIPLFCHHPYCTMLLVGIVAPILVLMAVALSACLVALPFGLIFGW